MASTTHTNFGIDMYDEPLLYPVLDKLANYTYKSVAACIGEEGNVCRLYQDPAFQNVFGEEYRKSMNSANYSTMSNARKSQYDTVSTLARNYMFSAGYMNTLLDREGHRLLLVFSNDRQNVDPQQDAMENHLRWMAEIAGTRQMTIELFQVLLANIWSFTPIEKKPIIVLDSKTGSGKSYCASVAKIIMTWKNDHAARKDDYASYNKSKTVQSASGRYSCVLGTHIIDGWNPKSRTTQTFMKNLYDSGRSVCKRKDRAVETHYNISSLVLDDRTRMILTSDFKGDVAFQDRCIVNKSPALNVSAISYTPKEKEKQLNDAAIPAHFALIRLLISDQINRDFLNLSLKANDLQQTSSTYETQLTLERISSVLKEMGFSENILTQRMGQNINMFALILAHYRASFEVYGSVWKTAHPRKPTPNETLEEYNDYLVNLMTNFLWGKSQDERDLMMAQRVVIDPTDIITASTLLLHLDKEQKTSKKSTTRMFVEKCLCQNMTDMKSVMYFDRDLVYQTQQEEDAIHFVIVDSVKEGLPEGKLPEWETSYVSHKTYTENEDVYSEILSRMTEEETSTNKYTFKHGHRQRNLALKHLYATNKMNQLIKETDEEGKSTTDKKTIFNEKIEKHLSYTEENDLRHLLYPILKKDTRFACDVYYEGHPFLNLCYQSTKRQAESFEEPQAKRVCISH